MKTIITQEYTLLLHLLIEARKSADVTQIELAAILNKPQSFVSKYERAERRLDVVEFITISRHLGCDPHVLISKIEQAVTDNTKADGQ